MPETLPDRHVRSGRYLRALAGLLLLSGAATFAVTWIEQSTRDTIEINEQAHALEILSSVLPPGSYDNQPATDVLLFSDAELLGSPDAQPVYSARRNGEVVANVVTAIAPEGYVAPIQLLIGITADGRITGVRAIRHSETPGLGDRIEADKSDWIQTFEQRRPVQNYANIALREDGGDIDHITGATITSRAVTNAIANALRFHARNQARLLEPLPETANAAASKKLNEN